ncbi:MAG: T9SS type A sorting domain-containing protein [Bacteroidia bacterium]|nr:T9SS type A sorting domain-containing protein [Bacteroidia bacterium]
MKTFTFFILGIFSFSLISYGQLAHKTGNDLKCKHSNVITSKTDRRLVKDILTFGDVLWSETLGGPALPTGWTVYDSTGNNYNWKWSNVGPTGAWTHPVPGAYPTPIPVLSSTTSANGFMMLPSDYYNTLPSGAMAATLVTMNAWVKTAAIDCSTFTSVMVTFQQQFRYCCNESTAVFDLGVSTDGVTWVEHDVRGGQAVNLQTADPDTVLVNITGEAAGHSTVYLRFWQTGLTHYYWMIDDIALIEAPSDDMELNGSHVASIGTYSTGLGNTGYYSQVPLRQIMPMSFVGDTYNNGNNTEHNVSFNTKVYNLAGTQMWTGSAVLASVPFNEYDTLMIDTPYFIATPNLIETYHTAYSVTQTETDQVPADNSYKADTIRVSCNVFARDLYYNARIGPMFYTGGTDGDLMGNMFHTTSLDTVVSLQVYINKHTTALTTMIGYVFSVDESTGTKTQQIASLEYTILATDTNKWVELTLIPYNPGDNILVANKDYIAGVECYYGTDTLLIGADNTTTDNFNDSESLIRLGGTWYRIDICPMIRMKDNKNCSDNVPEIHKGQVKIYPNPSRDIINIVSSRNSSIYVFDMLGNLVSHIDKSDAFTTINLSGCSSGMYMVKVVSSDQVHTEKINLLK